MARHGVNQTLMAVIVREMPTQPGDAREWFMLFVQVARDVATEYVAEFGRDKTSRAIERIIDHYNLAT